MKHRKATNINKSRQRLVDKDNQAMSLKDENNDIYGFEKDISNWLNHRDE